MKRRGGVIAVIGLIVIALGFAVGIISDKIELFLVAFAFGMLIIIIGAIIIGKDAAERRRTNASRDLSAQIKTNMNQLKNREGERK